MGIPDGDLSPQGTGMGKKYPRKSSWGSPRGICFVAGTGMGSQNPTGISPLPSLGRGDRQERTLENGRSFGTKD
jgi:hypothetical protein